MVEVLSEAWCQRRAELAGRLQVRPGASARLLHVVVGAPQGEVRYVEVFEDGRLVACTLGGDDAADVTMTVSWEDELAIARGALDLHAGFMQGRIKLVGDMGAFMSVLPVTQGAELAAVRDELAATTDAPA